MPLRGWGHVSMASHPFSNVLSVESISSDELLRRRASHAHGIANALLALKANVDATDHFGNTPLLYAAMRGDRQLARLLLQHSASMTFRNNDALNACEIALIFHDVEMLRLFSEFGSDRALTGLNEACRTARILQRSNDEGRYWIELDSDEDEIRTQLGLTSDEDSSELSEIFGEGDLVPFRESSVSLGGGAVGTSPASPTRRARALRRRKKKILMRSLQREEAVRQQELAEEERVRAEKAAALAAAAKEEQRRIEEEAQKELERQRLMDHDPSDGGEEDEMVGSSLADGFASLADWWGGADEDEEQKSARARRRRSKPKFGVTDQEPRLAGDEHFDEDDEEGPRGEDGDVGEDGDELPGSPGSSRNLSARSSREFFSLGEKVSEAKQGKSVVVNMEERKFSVSQNEALRRLQAASQKTDFDDMQTCFSTLLSKFSTSPEDENWVSVLQSSHCSAKTLTFLEDVGVGLVAIPLFQEQSDSLFQHGLPQERLTAPISETEDEEGGGAAAGAGEPRSGQPDYQAFVDRAEPEIAAFETDVEDLHKNFAKVPTSLKNHVGGSRRWQEIAAVSDTLKNAQRMRVSLATCALHRDFLRLDGLVADADKSLTRGRALAEDAATSDVSTDQFRKVALEALLDPDKELAPIRELAELGLARPRLEQQAKSAIQLREVKPLQEAYEIVQRYNLVLGGGLEEEEQQLSLILFRESKKKALREGLENALAAANFDLILTLLRGRVRSEQEEDAAGGIIAFDIAGCDLLEGVKSFRKKKERIEVTSVPMFEKIDPRQYSPRTRSDIELLQKVEKFARREAGRQRGMKLLQEMMARAEGWETRFPDPDPRLELEDPDLYEEEKEKLVEDLKEITHFLHQGVRKCVSIYLLTEEELEEAEYTRKHIHNHVEDLKGSVRVFCRIRPLLKFEADHGHKSVLQKIDAMTLEVPEQGMFAFDAVWFPGTQQKVFHQAKDLVQSACDGYNVTVRYGRGGDELTTQITLSPTVKYMLVRHDLLVMVDQLQELLAQFRVPITTRPDERPSRDIRPVSSWYGGRGFDNWFFPFLLQVFAYGQTGGGKTYTMSGDPDNPGLVRNFSDEIFRLVKEDKTRYETDVKISMVELYMSELVDLLDHDEVE